MLREIRGFALSLMTGWLVLVGAFAGSEAWARTCFDEGFLPRNSVRIPADSAFANSEMTRDQFNRILDVVEQVYAPIAARKGGQLVIERAWEDPQVNAFADRNGSRWIIRMLGGLARHPEVTLDGFALVACHEVGHHLGGAPKYPGHWAIDEGQSDYFATLKCLRNVFAAMEAPPLSESPPDTEAIRSCRAVFSGTDATRCIRESMAGLSAARLSRSISGGAGDVAFATPDTTVVVETYHDHPLPQCRLDTYFQGSLCAIGAAEELSDTDPRVGACTVESGFSVGSRPRCWYAPATAPNPPPVPPLLPRSPTIQGSTYYWLRNPAIAVPVTYDVSGIPGAAGAYLEFSAANGSFSVPNGTRPDPFRSFWAAQPGVFGTFWITPARALPGWGVYQFRVIPLDGAGREPVAVFSNPSVLVLQP